MPRSERRSPCPISFSLDLLGDRWTLLVVRDLVFRGKRRFSEFRDSPEGIATNVLSERLQRLLDAGVIECDQDPEDGRRMLYRLTDKGIDLIPTLVELFHWGARHDPATPVSAKLLRRLELDREGYVEELVARHRPG